MVCPRCGRSAESAQRFCTACGAELAAGEPGAVPAKIPSYLVAGIVITLCLCAPIGIVTIVYGAQVDAKLRAGDVAGARASSRQARGWAIAGGVLGGGLAIAYLAVLIFAPQLLAD